MSPKSINFTLSRVQAPGVSTYSEQEYNPQRVLIYFEKGYKTTFPSLARRGVCAAGADGGGLFKVPRQRLLTDIRAKRAPF